MRPVEILVVLALLAMTVGLGGFLTRRLPVPVVLVAVGAGLLVVSALVVYATASQRFGWGVPAAQPPPDQHA